MERGLRRESITERFPMITFIIRSRLKDYFSFFLPILLFSSPYVCVCVCESVYVLCASACTYISLNSFFVTGCMCICVCVRVFVYAYEL